MFKYVWLIKNEGREVNSTLYYAYVLLYITEEIDYGYDCVVYCI